MTDQRIAKMNAQINQLFAAFLPMRLVRIGLITMLLAIFFSSGSSIHAELIIRSVNVSLNATNLESFALDLDSNGSTDFTFNASFIPDPLLPVGFDVIEFPFASKNGVVIDSFTGNGFPNASLLSLGNLVSDTQLFSLAAIDQGNLFFTAAGDPPSGNFLNRTGYVGLKFDRPGGVSFGFAELTVNDINAPGNPLGLTIGTVGYNNTLGAPAQISSIPEPTSFMLFVVSSLATITFRRKRSSRLRVADPAFSLQKFSLQTRRGAAFSRRHLKPLSQDQALLHLSRLK
jgi:hypothetical protein